MFIDSGPGRVPKRSTRIESSTDAAQVYTFFHGTSWELAQAIEREGFLKSSDGCLGPGVYVGREGKALRFARDGSRHGGNAGGLIKVKVRVYNPKLTETDDRAWRYEGFDACRADYTTR